MKPTSLTIKELFTKNPDLTFLVGAGCSVDAPSCQPAGRAMMNAIIKCTCADSEIDKILNLEELRFEALVEIVRDLIDTDLKVIDYYGLCDKPNIQHFFLAEMIKQGHFVMTTNFDFLIEYALLKLDIPKEEIEVVITKEAFEKFNDPDDLFNQGIKTLYKIHGSTKNIIKSEDTKDTLVATIQAFGSNKEGLNVFQVEPFKRVLFDNISSGRTLVVMGYSGSDDFDIVPTLKILNKLKNVIWINFIADDSKQEKIYEVIAIPGQKSNRISKVNEILMDIQRVSNIKQIYRVDVNTTRLVKELLDKEPILSLENFSINPMDWLKENITIPSDVLYYYLPYKIYSDFDKFKDALRCLEKVLEIAKKSGEKKWISTAFNNLGLIYRKQGKYSEALNQYEKAIQINNEIGDILFNSTCLHNIASLYMRQGKYNEAREKYEEALKIDESTNNLIGKVSHLNSYGNLLSLLGDNTKALKLYNESLKIAEQLGDLKGKAFTMSCLGDILKKQGEYPKALKYYEESFKIYEKLGAVVDKALLIRSIGNVYGAQGDFLNALKKYEEGLELTEQIGDINETALFINNTAEIYRLLGDYEEAFKKYQESLSIHEKLGNMPGKEAILNNIGLNYYDQGNFTKALEYYRESFEIAKKLGQKSSIANGLNNIGMAFEGLKRYAEALEYIQEALKKHEVLNSPADIANCLMNMGGIYFKQEDYQNALVNLEKALGILEELNDLHSKANCLNTISAIHYMNDNYSKSGQLLNEALDILNKLGLGDTPTAENIKDNLEKLKKFL